MKSVEHKMDITRYLSTLKEFISILSPSPFALSCMCPVALKLLNKVLVLALSLALSQINKIFKKIFRKEIQKVANFLNEDLGDEKIICRLKINYGNIMTIFLNAT